MYVCRFNFVYMNRIINALEENVQTLINVGGNVEIRSGVFHRLAYTWFMYNVHMYVYYVRM